MIQWMVAALRLRREEERCAGKAWAQGVIDRDGVTALKARLDDDQPKGWGRSAFDEGVLDALQGADRPE